MNENDRVLVLNPGSTSTKFGVYTRDGAEWERTIRHGMRNWRDSAESRWWRGWIIAPG